MNNYRFDDHEIGTFYRHVATKRPNEQNRGGGIRFVHPDFQNANDKMNILAYYRNEFIASSLVKEAGVIERTQKRIFAAIRNSNPAEFEKLNLIPDINRGKELVSGKLPKGLRDICRMFDSVLNGRPSQYAKAFFA